jgi:hypothetical protein
MSFQNDMDIEKNDYFGSLNIPIELQDQKITGLDFGNIDNDQKRLICDLNALDLVLIENAGDILNRTDILNEANLFRILNLIKDETCNTRCESFPYILFPENKKSDEYKQALYKFSEYIKLSTKPIIFTLLAIDMGYHGGHFAAIIINVEKKTVDLFDSMQIDYHSYFTKYFKVFIESAGYKVNIPDCISKELSLQYTGGFIFNNPLWYDKYVESIENMNRKDAMNAKAYIKKNQKDILIQSTESQNHFCYMWAVWYINIKLLNIELDKALLILNSIDPLIIIKRYIWYVFKYTGLIDHLIFRKFFERHFPCYWKSGFKDGMFYVDGRYSIKMKADIPKSMRQCLEWSIESDECVKDNITPSDSVKYLLKCNS